VRRQQQWVGAVLAAAKANHRPACALRRDVPTRCHRLAQRGVERLAQRGVRQAGVLGALSVWLPRWVVGRQQQVGGLQHALQCSKLSGTEWACGHQGVHSSRRSSRHVRLRDCQPPGTARDWQRPSSTLCV
jgi:hypothetical protein